VQIDGVIINPYNMVIKYLINSSEAAMSGREGGERCYATHQRRKEKAPQATQEGSKGS
jgi:hypothetical protein